MLNASTRSIPLLSTLLFGAVTMSLGWGLRGTIGGGPIGAMIPGVMIALAISLAFNLRRDLAMILVFGAVGVGLGGQETYGQTIGFVRTGPMWWGLWGMTVKGAVWGLSGGILLGLGLVRKRYTKEELLWGLLILLAFTVCGRQLLSEPKLYYFSNRWDKPREEMWLGLLLGSVALQGYLLLLKRETVSLNFAFWGMLAGAIGFGGGGLFFPLSEWIQQKVHEESSWKFLREIPPWKCMEFWFGLMLGLGYSWAAWLQRSVILAEEEHEIAQTDAWDGLPGIVRLILAILIPPFALWFHFTIDIHPIMFSLTGTLLLIAALGSNHAAWHIAISMTITAFIRDHMYSIVEKRQIELENPASWLIVFLIAIPVVTIVEILPKRGRLFPFIALLLVAWPGIATALDKIAMQNHGNLDPTFVVQVFLCEGVLMSMLAAVFQRRNRLSAISVKSSA